MTSTIEPPGAGTDVGSAGVPGRGLAAAVIASMSAIGMLVASLVLAWQVASLYEIGPWTAVSLILAAYIIVAGAVYVVANRFNRVVDRREDRF
jgi:hypothetical protein